MTPQTPMLIGSVSKSFTALVVMQLVEVGKMNLDMPLLGVLLNQPDLSWVILSGGTLALLNGMFRSGRNAWKISKQICPPEKANRNAYLLVDDTS